MTTTATAHLPQVTSQSLPLLAAHLNVAHQATPSSHTWSLSITSLRAASLDHSPLLSPVLGQARPSHQTRRAWLANLNSLLPALSFLLIEDAARPSRQEAQQAQAAERAGDDALALAGLGSASPAPMTAKFSSTSDQPTHPRHTLLTLGSGALTLLLRLNLPPPLGAPSSGDGNAVIAATRGPGAWEIKGPSVRLDGPSWLIDATPTTIEVKEKGKWNVRLGEIKVGKAETRGCLLQVEYLGSSTPPLLPSTFLASLFPDYLLRPPTTQSTSSTATAGSPAPLPANTGATLVHANLTPQLWAEVRPGSTLPTWDQLTSTSKVEDQELVNHTRHAFESQALTCISLLRSRGVL